MSRSSFIADPGVPPDGDGDHHATLSAQYRQVSWMLVAELVERLHAAGFADVTPAWQAVFEKIDRNGTRLTVLAPRAEMTHPSMSELVNLLERRGYVERRPDLSDGRARLVYLTQQGRQAVRAALSPLAAIAEIETHCYARTEAGID